jgi:hypothetical protein
VKGGGSLLVIADEAPYAQATDVLTRKFGVEMGGARVVDTANSTDALPDGSLLVFSRENKLLVAHPIIEGRSAEERVNRVIGFGGQSLKLPADAGVLLRLGESARAAGSDKAVAGAAQAAALKVGKGRVVVVGSTALLSAQLAGVKRQPIGMNYPGYDNARLALNVMHWLSGILK